ncbi:Choline-sulfatase [Rubripirellula lacrimiformis]|uniref:Choline-sulfatase n=1 Tax=Rubripirellula lacrimiformis TaxID=1930273 RepID=A0A517NH70_9BACT|nr:sulfatase-like hydrolase/transferase [Rubripirellula lacrimiformis]QDT06484.1 Choline-sulfatase [Rubripirellula lacrimiformis]
MLRTLTRFVLDGMPLVRQRCSCLWRGRIALLVGVGIVGGILNTPLGWAQPSDRPHIVLVMADDQGWGETGYNGHPLLKTPHLDAMANHGLRLDRFYAGAPVCSPTRAAVLTGRTNDRTGVESHGYALRRQEITVSKLLRDAGYVTGHFGKWHLNGLRGPGVPILDSDSHHPGKFGFDHWLSVTNFFDRDPLLSRRGKFEDFEGDSSEIVVDEAIDFIARQSRAGLASFTVIWFGTPHSPFKAVAEDMVDFQDLDESSMNHYGELVAMDRSIGTLRLGLRELGIAEDTLLWYCSDNGGLPKIKPDTTGGLRGNKGKIFEGGLRVPAIIEWPAVITQSRITETPACVMDIAATLLDITGVAHPAPDRPADGISLLPLIQGDDRPRRQPIGFRFGRASAMNFGDGIKLVSEDGDPAHLQMYDLKADPYETTDLSGQHAEELAKRTKVWSDWMQSVDDSFAGKDYPERKVDPSEPEPRWWDETDLYQTFLPQFRERWEYQSWLKRKKR